MASFLTGAETLTFCESFWRKVRASVRFPDSQRDVRFFLLAPLVSFIVLLWDSSILSVDLCVPRLWLSSFLIFQFGDYYVFSSGDYYVFSSAFIKVIIRLGICVNYPVLSASITLAYRRKNTDAISSGFQARQLLQWRICHLRLLRNHFPQPPIPTTPPPLLLNPLLTLLSPKLQVDAGENNFDEKTPEVATNFQYLYLANHIEKFKIYEADYARRLMAKYFSKKNLYGGNVFDENVTIDNELIKSSRHSAGF
ncbi:uncharacterized protein LOC112091239 [Morus notabilis]|uniref:uncharacterized protein LOC112091239 n=1 Tax=Morus notabilis TaxID=981085 RepID=UPI000CED6ABE|nr:uncharacterized protein LOC112091239 [Morus notabilis]